MKPLLIMSFLLRTFLVTLSVTFIREKESVRKVSRIRHAHGQVLAVYHCLMEDGQ